MDSGSEGESFEENVHRFDLKFSGLLLGLLEKIVVVERGRQSENVASLLFRSVFSLCTLFCESSVQQE